MPLSNRIRYYYFISGVLARQSTDVHCVRCKALGNSVRAVREGIEDLERTRPEEIRSLLPELSRLLDDAQKTIGALNPPADAVGQKKAGNCKMPEGVCFVKSSKAIVEKIPA